MSFPLVEYLVVFISLYAPIFYALVLLGYRREIFAVPASIPEKELPFVSVVIPTFNEEKAIEGTLESILALDYPREKLQVIVVDDESKDNTVSIVKGFAKRGVQLVKNKHSGIGKSSALNTGIAHCHGEFIATVDSDSFPNRDALKILLSHFRDPTVMAATATVKVYNRKTVLERVQHVEYEFGMLARRLLSFLEGVTVTPGPLSVFRKRFFDKHGGFDENSLSEDLEMACKVQLHNYRIVCSMAAQVYTIVPSKLSDLVKQRVRWNRGSMRTLFKYRKLLSPAFGDLGTVVFPLALAYIFVILFVFGNLLIDLLSGKFLGWFWLDGVIYSIGAGQVLVFLVIAIGILWLFFANYTAFSKRLPLSELLLFLATYTYLVGTFWVTTMVQEVLMQRQKW